MSKEQIIDEAYVNYGQKIISEDLWMLVAIGWPSNQEEFINKCKTDTEFSEKWGLKIEEREFSLEERCELGYKYVDAFEWDMLMGGGREGDEGNCNDYYIPTKLITITYNDKTIESYE
jgi:hypothetical protein